MWTKTYSYDGFMKAVCDKLATLPLDVDNASTALYAWVKWLLKYNAVVYTEEENNQYHIDELFDMIYTHTPVYDKRTHKRVSKAVAFFGYVLEYYMAVQH